MTASAARPSVLLLVATVRGMTRTRLTVIALALAVAVTACGGDPEPAAAPTPAATPSSAAPSSAAPSPTGPDGYAQRACQKNTTAQTGDTDLKLYAEVATEAQQSSSEPIVHAGAALDEHVKLAEAAQGAEDQVLMEAGLIASSFDFTAACAGVGIAY